MRSIGWGRPFFVHALLVLLALVVAQSCPALTFYAFPPYPTGKLLYAQPTLRWKVWPSDPYHVQSVEMTLNGTPVPARYETETRAAVYTPGRPLPAGDYSVHCAIILDEGEPLQRDWNFTVSDRALAELPAPDHEPQRALDLANCYRRQMGLPDMRLSTALCASAEAHARYLDTNNEFGHYETAGHHDFVGRTLLERDAAFGYSGGGYEDVSYGNSSSEIALQRLFDAPYHRIPFMQPGTPDFGMGRIGQQTTLEFGLTEEEGVSVYPANGQENVPRSWSGNEEPDPLWPHRAHGRTGYIISCLFFGAGTVAIDVTTATLTDDAGNAVPCYVNTPENDSHLQNGVFLIPEQPLRPNTTYTAEVKAATSSGKDISRLWKFTTERAPMGRSGKRR